jgi:hypothetical protein
MTEKPENPLAFPFAENGNPFGNYHGMTLRDYLAAHAPITLADVYHTFFDNKPDIGEPNTELLMKAFAKVRYQYADAMLEARQS